MSGIDTKLAAIVCVALAGCATTPRGEKIDEGGRFMQSVYADWVLEQVDFPTSAMCAADLKASVWKHQGVLRCSQTSQADRLPYAGVSKIPDMGLELNLHFRTNERCDAFKNRSAGSTVVTTCLGIK